MTQKEVYKAFELFFPQYTEHINVWFPNGKNSIRIRLANGNEFIFTCDSKGDWRFETLDSFLNDIQNKIKR